MLRRLPAAYVLAVAAVAVARGISGQPTTSALGLTPDRLAAGKIWLLFSSGFIVNGAPLPQLAGLAATAVVFERAFAPRAFAIVAPLSHVGATLLAYGALAVFTGDPDGSRNAGIDYGISAVWLGMLGALFAVYLTAARRGVRPAVAVILVATAAFVVGIAAFPVLSACEHGFAFGLGAAAARRCRRARWPARSGASRACGPAASA